MADAGRSSLAHMRSRLDATMGCTASLSELPIMSQTTLRGNAGEEAFRRAAHAALGFDLPTSPGATISGHGSVVLCLGPDEWLLVRVEEGEIALRSRLRETLAGQHVAVVDTSAARVVLQLAGNDARRVLETGCALDLHPRAFLPGSCARTVVGPVEVILLQPEDEPLWWLFIQHSYAEWFTEWLLDALSAVEQGTDRNLQG